MNLSEQVLKFKVEESLDDKELQELADDIQDYLKKHKKVSLMGTPGLVDEMVGDGNWISPEDVLDVVYELESADVLVVTDPDPYEADVELKK